MKVLDDNERKEEEDTLKRLEKNMEKFYKGGAKLLRDIVSKNVSVHMLFTIYKVTSKINRRGG